MMLLASRMYRIVNGKLPLQYDTSYAYSPGLSQTTNQNIDLEFQRLEICHEFSSRDLNSKSRHLICKIIIQQLGILRADLDINML